MASEHSAADAIRASVQALPEHYRLQWWTDATGDVYSGTGSGEDACVAETGTLYRAAARHIARLASPDVALALAELLDAIHRERPFESDSDMQLWGLGVQDTAHALEAAILRSGT